MQLQCFVEYTTASVLVLRNETLSDVAASVSLDAALAWAALLATVVNVDALGTVSLLDATTTPPIHAAACSMLSGDPLTPFAGGTGPVVTAAARVSLIALAAAGAAGALPRGAVLSAAGLAVPATPVVTGEHFLDPKGGGVLPGDGQARRGQVPCDG